MAGLLSALSSAVASLFISEPRHPGISGPSTQDILDVRYALLSRLPLELVDPILHEAEYYTRVYAEEGTEIVVKSDSCCYVQTPPLPTSSVMRVVITIESHDQGWSSFPEHWGSYENSWTWFRAVLRRGEECVGSWDICRNRHADEHWRKRTVVWEKPEDHPLMKELRAGDRIEIWPEARYPGWMNFVRYASVEVLCWI